VSAKEDAGGAEVEGEALLDEGVMLRMGAAERTMDDAEGFV
jgi:hypothetical protein